ncbi:MAG: hypothetical protein Q7W55_04930 [Pseudohongiella sp.]|nr:hypothetical protein [Pseudohongiella sp.]
MKLLVPGIFIFVMALSTSALQAQPRALEEALADGAVQAALQQISDSRLQAAQHLVEIGGIVSPSGQEHETADCHHYWQCPRPVDFSRRA